MCVHACACLRTRMRARVCVHACTRTSTQFLLLPTCSYSSCRNPQQALSQSRLPPTRHATSQSQHCAEREDYAMFIRLLYQSPASSGSVAVIAPRARDKSESALFMKKAPHIDPRTESSAGPRCVRSGNLYHSTFDCGRSKLGTQLVVIATIFQHSTSRKIEASISHS